MCECAAVVYTRPTTIILHQVELVNDLLLRLISLSIWTWVSLRRHWIQCTSSSSHRLFFSPCFFFNVYNSAQFDEMRRNAGLNLELNFMHNIGELNWGAFFFTTNLHFVSYSDDGSLIRIEIGCTKQQGKSFYSIFLCVSHNNNLLSIFHL